MAQSGVGGICSGTQVQPTVLSTGSSSNQPPAAAAQQQPSSTTGTGVSVASLSNQSQTQFQSSTNPQFTRLRVEDALSYLDQVKIKFASQPQVYNDFLDIMKEFKSQTIDTPGVIQRVSSLFRGHPELIVGFNTFLPPGYKIEMHSNEQVQVSMPSSTLIISGGSIIHNNNNNSTTSNNISSLVNSSSSNTNSIPLHVIQTTGSNVTGESGSGPALQRFTGTNTNSTGASGGGSAINLTSSNTSSNTIASTGAAGTHLASTGGGSTSVQQASAVVAAAAAAVGPIQQQQQQHSSAPAPFSSHSPATPTANAGNISVRNAHAHPLVVSAKSTALSSSTLAAGSTAVNYSASANKSNNNNNNQQKTPPQDSPVNSHATTNGGTQPVEFNHAINYVNKIKLRFQAQPEVYKQFLEILHAYQKEHKNVKEGKNSDRSCLTESEVYAQVARLFQNDEDLLQEFGQFLPDANSATTGNFSTLGHSVSSYTGHQHSITQFSQNVDDLAVAAAHRAATNDHGAIVKKPLSRPGLLNQTSSLPMKRLGTQPPYGSGMNKRFKMTSLRDVTFSDAFKVGSLTEFGFFDKVRKALRSQEVFENFLRCLVIYNHEIISRSELLYLVNPFLSRYPELLKWLKDFLQQKDSTNFHSNFNSGHTNNLLVDFSTGTGRGAGGGIRERMTTETGMEIDYAACKRYGASYRALPKNYPQPTCTGRTALCKEVLNDTWVSFPSWSEDSTFVTSKKTQYEEYISKCEDERYELDVVIETNLSTIRVLEVVQKKLNRMSPEERNRFRLDDTLGGTSTTIHQRAIRRIYGDKANEIVEGLKKNPVVAVPIVLRRLKNKEEEWREAQKSFNKIWREQNERYYLKSLDHQGISFKQNDIRYLRSKSLIHEIENLYEERHEQNEDATSGGESSHVITSGPHITLHYQDKSMIEEACNLIIHHIKRQTSIHKQDKQKIKQLMRHFIPDLFNTPRGELSDDEIDECDFDRENVTSRLNTNSIEGTRSQGGSLNGTSNNNKSSSTSNANGNGNCNQADSSTDANNLNCTRNGNSGNGNGGGSSSSSGNTRSDSPKQSHDEYTLFFANNNWYLFFRLHNILCQRLATMYQRAQIIASEEAKDKSNRKDSVALRLKPKNDTDAEEYFPTFVDMVKSVLDGNLDSNQFEDMLREMFGIHAYIGFTMDKVVQNICRQLQHIVCDESCTQCTHLFIDELKSGGLSTGGSVETQSGRLNYENAYQKKAEGLLPEENCYKIVFYKREGKVTIELLDTEQDENENKQENERWANYIEKYALEDESISDEVKERLCRIPIFLTRNIPPWRRKAAENVNSNSSNVDSNSSLQASTENASKEQPSNLTSSAGNNSQTNLSTTSVDECKAGADSVTSDEAAGKNSQTSTENESVDPAKSKQTSSKDASNKATDEETSQLKDLNVKDNTQCRFNVNSYKMLYVVEGNDWMHRRSALSKARSTHKALSQRMYSRFTQIHSKWLKKFDSDDVSNCVNWLEGTSGILQPDESRKTLKVTINDKDHEPYRTYFRYKVVPS